MARRVTTYKHGEQYRFDELDNEHQDEILGHLTPEEAASSVWLFSDKYPTYEAVWIAKQAADLNLVRVDAVVRALERGGQLRPILISEIVFTSLQEAGEEESAYWIEGQHRAKAAEELGLKTVPVLLRID